MVAVQSAGTGPSPIDKLPPCPPPCMHTTYPDANISKSSLLSSATLPGPPDALGAAMTGEVHSASVVRVSAHSSCTLRWTTMATVS